MELEGVAGDKGDQIHCIDVWSMMSNAESARKKHRQWPTRQRYKEWLPELNSICSKSIINKWDITKLKIIPIVNETNHQVNVKTIMWKRIFARYASNRILKPKINKELKKHTVKETYLIPTIPKGEFSEEQLKMAKK